MFRLLPLLFLAGPVLAVTISTTIVQSGISVGLLIDLNPTQSTLIVAQASESGSDAVTPSSTGTSSISVTTLPSIVTDLPISTSSIALSPTSAPPAGSGTLLSTIPTVTTGVSLTQTSLASTSPTTLNTLLTSTSLATVLASTSPAGTALPATDSLLTGTSTTGIAIKGTSLTTASTTSSFAFSTTFAVKTRTIHEVQVGPNDTLNFVPNQVNAQVNDLVLFRFHRLNHTMTQSSLENPCNPSNGFDTGFNQFNAADSTQMTVAFTVNTPDPQFFFCHQSLPVPHCELGMIFAINPGLEMDPFVNNMLTVGPLSSLVTSVSLETVTLTSSGALETATLSDVDLPLAALTTSSATVPDVLLPGQGASASTTSALASPSGAASETATSQSTMQTTVSTSAVSPVTASVSQTLSLTSVASTGSETASTLLSTLEGAVSLAPMTTAVSSSGGQGNSRVRRSRFLLT